MNKLCIPALIATAAFSTGAFAHDGWDGHRWNHGHHHGPRMERVMVQPVYMAPAVAYAPPPVVYRQQVVYREQPVYYEAAPRYSPPPRVYGSYGTNPVMGQAIGAVAGGVIGNQFGQGNGKVAATAAGAVIGSIVGGNVATYGY
ncbi:MAG: putative surface antigen protein [Rhodocyclaceae bacterium]|nr:putative surface antigen protein [Rhodocyclaceae bacterium]